MHLSETLTQWAKFDVMGSLLKNNTDYRTRQNKMAIKLFTVWNVEHAVSGTPSCSVMQETGMKLR